MHNRQSLLYDPKARLVAACVLATLLLLVFQAWLTASALTGAGSGGPVEVRNTRRQLDELAQVQQAAAQRRLLTAADLPVRFGIEAVAAATVAGAPVAGGTGTADAPLEMVLVPGLNGILEERDATGALRYRACFAQGVFAAGDSVGEFRLRSVAVDRAVLVRRGETFVVRLTSSSATP